MKLCVACLARTDMTPRPAEVREAVRPKLDSIFDVEEDELPTTLHVSRRAPVRAKASRKDRQALAFAT